VVYEKPYLSFLCLRVYVSMSLQINIYEKIMEQRPKKLLDQVLEAIWRKCYSNRTEQSYAVWIKRYILFHNKRHPQEMGWLGLLYLIFILYNKTSSNTTWGRKYDEYSLIRF